MIFLCVFFIHCYVEGLEKMLGLRDTLHSLYDQQDYATLSHVLSLSRRAFQIMSDYCNAMQVRLVTYYASTKLVKSGDSDYFPIS